MVADFFIAILMILCVCSIALGTIGAVVEGLHDFWVRVFLIGGGLGFLGCLAYFLS